MPPTSLSAQWPRPPARFWLRPETVFVVLPHKHMEGHRFWDFRLQTEG